MSENTIDTNKINDHLNKVIENMDMVINRLKDSNIDHIHIYPYQLVKTALVAIEEGIKEGRFSE